MKKIGIVFAMKEEMVAFKKYFDVCKEQDIYNLHFYEGTIHGNYCILVTSGVGKVNAARTTQVLIDNYKVDYVINVGVAGGICDNLYIGDIIVGERLVQHDFNIMAFNHERGYIPDIGVYIGANEYLVNLSEKTLKKNKIDYRKGVIASGDIFCTKETMSKKIFKNFNAMCVEMEGAAIAHVCFVSNVPFLILRSISDIPNNDNAVTFDKFLVSSSKKIALVLNDLLAEINNVEE